ncbi:hypothetical protein K490DRAFT_61718 [Saccharata proteae CBS 121410]|uniref:Transcription factor SipA3 n=1 Tax=Saccharata proteae CBS 121410 TaxID=1314787 RepID=A0A9P4M2G6_9PEZI|nr:hypothetical protein K490DRAFT_61718 [Saccharata proteae CBS 121410]
MADENRAALPPALMPVVKPLSLIPVVLKEAALDSPTFRATVSHFGDQIDAIERWLESLVKAATKLSQEVSTLESVVNNFVAQSAPPQQVSEAVLDHDYTILAIKRYSEGAREFWKSTLSGVKRVDTIVDPVRTFLQNDLRGLKDTRKTLAATQKEFDGLIARYAGRKKTEEASSLREDAFQLHEARKSYLKASMDFCVMTPQIKITLDKLLVKIFSDRWRELKASREPTTNIFTKYSSEMDRVRGWSREMENGERVFKRELHMARKQLEESAENGIRPSRELDDYSISTVPYLGSQGLSTSNLQSPAKLPGSERTEKQGWLFERTITGKPARTIWVRRWFFVKNGIFGWLAHGARSGAVEESEKTGVLLCGVRPAFQEERRFCFEVKTKDRTNILQAETQSELMEWLQSFEAAKRNALEDPASTDDLEMGIDAAFAITAPVAPEFAARNPDGHAHHGSDEASAMERSGTLPLPDRDLPSRSSFDVGKRVVSGDREGESSRDHAARIIQKLDLHRKQPAGPQLTGIPSAPNPSTGIAGLISASHNIHNLLPVAPQSAQSSLSADARLAMMPTSSLAPSTLAAPPASTNLSKAAVIVSGERGVGIGRPDGGMPSGILANLWGSSNWGHFNRLERGELKLHTSHAPHPALGPIHRAATTLEGPHDTPADSTGGSTTAVAKSKHRKTMSLASDPSKLDIQRPVSAPEDYPPYYPLPLRAQDAQFRMLFPAVPREEKVVLVFRATWAPDEQQEFPGRVYLTTANIYFYSNHIGLILITGFELATIEDVTAAPGKDCDFLFVHLKESIGTDSATRITIKTFLEPLKLLQRRLNFLVRNAAADEPAELEEVVRALLKMENDDSASPGTESWEDVSALDTPIDGARDGSNVKASLRIDGNLFADPRLPRRNPTRFKLPSQPVKFSPQGMTRLATEREFDISAKALFHCMFGDKSAVFQMLCRERWAQRITQGPWKQPDQGLLKREFVYQTQQDPDNDITDYQVIEVLNDHLCYVVTHKQTPWYLPHSKDFMLVSKMVITHHSKSMCKLAIWSKIEWMKRPPFVANMLERQGLEDLELEAQDLTDVIADQVHKLGSKSRTRKSVQIFGYVGHATAAAQVSSDDIPAPTKERKFKLVQRNMASMVLDMGSALAATVVSMAIGSLTTLLGALFKVCTAHSLLLGLLLFSSGMNMIWSYRDTITWWQERSAGKFMARMGVTPDVVMTKAVYLRDIEDVFANDTMGFINASTEAAGDSSCHQTFTHLLTTDPHCPSPGNRLSPSSPHLTPSTRSTATRLHRTRENLAAYRHDLLVAMRLVNRVEREVLEAEWENWVMDEVVRCRRVGEMIRVRGGGDESVEGLGDVREGWRSYCGSCVGEVERLGKGVGFVEGRVKRE